MTTTRAAPTPRRTRWEGGILILALGTLTAGLTGPGQTIGVSVFNPKMEAALNLSSERVSLAYLIGTLTGALLLPRVGQLIDARGVRRAQIIIGGLFALALVNMSFVNGFIWLAIGFTGIRFLGQGSLSLISTVTVSLGYVRNRGTALGVYSMASHGLMALVPFGLAITIAAVGWRSAWLVSAAVVLATVVPIAVFGLRRLPTNSASPVDPDDQTTTPAPSLDRSEAARTRSFWLLVAVSSSAGMMSTALNFYQISWMAEAGISEAAAAALFIPQVLGAAVAGLAIGWASDRIGTRYLPAICMALLVVSHLLAAIASPGFIVVGYGIVLGAMGGGVRTATASLLPAWFGTTHLGAVQGLLTFFNVGASALGPFALANARTWFGSYPPALLLLAVVPAAALIFSLFDDPKLRARLAKEAAAQTTV
ncbi:MAG: MFS transporter [Acidimicrobiales bacterium]|nr:MFS transporter [Acidimicrobiales bacterium]RZV45462.1 MAG: MFS transporter [Acidimicrobiales bacterium]